MQTSTITGSRCWAVQGPVGTYITGLDEGLRCRIAEAVKRAYCSGAPDGERSLTATAWAVRGTVI
jgi:hypothetical protein